MLSCDPRRASGGSPRAAWCWRRDATAWRAVRAGAVPRARPGYWAHSSDDIDFAALRGKTVGVIGAGASAVDNAAEALEAGAARVAMLVRRPDVPRVNRGMGIGSPGMWHGFSRLTPAQRWSIVQHIADHAIPPPRELHAALLAAQELLHRRALLAQGGCHRGCRVVLDTSRGRLAFDYLIVCTGFTVDWGRRPELASLAPHVLSGATVSAQRS